jgi:hypothetical protein
MHIALADTSYYVLCRIWFDLATVAVCSSHQRITPKIDCYVPYSNGLLGIIIHIVLAGTTYYVPICTFGSIYQLFLFVLHINLSHLN